uniref:Pheromone n=1 Tax=Lentinula edodes TaxID=5353 RepID=A0A2U9Q1H4_LENED|nr:Pheromone [Lentinula edodes]
MDSFNSLACLLTLASSNSAEVADSSESFPESSSALPFDLEHTDESGSTADTGFCVIA